MTLMTPTKTNRTLCTGGSGGSNGASGGSDNNISFFSSSSSHNLDDINLLLCLETHKRIKDNEQNIKQQTEDAFYNLQEHRYKYLDLYEKYTKLLKNFATRQLLQRQSFSNESTEEQLRQGLTDVQGIEKKLSSGSATDLINDEELEKFRHSLNETENYENIAKQSLELMHLKNDTKAIQQHTEAIESSLACSTAQGLDHFISELNMENFPNTLENHKDN